MKLLPYIIVLFAAILWGTTGTLQTYLQGGIAPISVAAFRSLFGGGILLIILVMMRKINFKTWSWKWTILAAILIGLFQTSFFSSIRLTGVAIGTVITIGSSPIFAGFIEWLLFKRRPNRIWAIATLLSVIGVALLFVRKGDSTIHPTGILFALCAGVLFALYTNFSKRLMEREHTLPAVAMTFTLCALFLLPFTFQNGYGWLTDSMNLVTILIMAFFATSLAYILFLYGLKRIPPSSAVTLSLAEPLTAALLGVFLLKEQLGVVSWIGITCILSGIIVLTFEGGRKTIAQKGSFFTSDES